MRLLWPPRRKPLVHGSPLDTASGGGEGPGRERLGSASEGAGVVRAALLRAVCYVVDTLFIQPAGHIWIVNSSTVGTGLMMHAGAITASMHGAGVFRT